MPRHSDASTDAHTTATSVTGTRAPYISVALISSAALAYEVLLMRMFSIIQWHHFAYMIISLALLGYGASGTFIVLARNFLLRRFSMAYWCNLVLFSLSTILCYLAAQQVPFNAEEVLWDWRQPLYLLGVYLLLCLPFFFAANVIALALTRYRQAIPRLYAADLLGAGLGSAGIVLVLFMVFPGQALQGVGALGMLGAFAAARELHMRPRSWQLLPLLGAGILLSLPGGWLEPHPSPYKELSQILRISGARIIDERSSPLGLITVVENTVLPLRHAPGLSLHAAEPIPEQLGLFTDADGMTAINHNPHRQALEYLEQMTSALPYQLADLQHVLILGAGGGTGIQLALNHNVPRIDAVELNPQVVGLVRDEYGAYSGHLYEREGVEVHVADARGFIKRNAAHYDLIQIDMLDAFGASSAGLHALNESYLYTVEALQDYLEHVAEGGYLAISRWIKLPPRDTLKLLATAVRALQAMGVDDPGQHMALIRGWQTGTLLIRKGRLTEKEIKSLRSFCETRAFDLAWYPGIQADETNRFNVLREPYFYQAAVALTSGRGEAFLEGYKFNISPATDDRPYFSHFFKWEVLPEILALRGSGGLPLLEAGYLVLLATSIQAVVLSVLLILVPLAILYRRQKGTKPQVSRTRVMVYFFAIGLAFLFIEIAFIQKFILFLHHPLYAAAIVLTTFLIFAGAGSAWTSRAQKAGPGQRHAATAVLCIAALGIAYTFLLGPVFSSLMPAHSAIRIIVSILLIAPMAFFMGMPFPLGLARLAQDMPAYIPWAWGINGCASVLSAVMATLLAIQFGFTAVLISALLLYILAAVMFP